VQIHSNKINSYAILSGLPRSIRSMKRRRGKAMLCVGDREESMPIPQDGIREKIGAFFRGIGTGSSL
jgi:hypothetical protein